MGYAASPLLITHKLMKNKELKVGDKIWLLMTHISQEDFYPVKRVKKKGTLVDVVVEAERYNGTTYEIQLYGHASSSILSGFDRWGRFRREECYTCEYGLVRDKTQYYEYGLKYQDIGRAAIRLVKELKL